MKTFLFARKQPSRYAIEKCNCFFLKKDKETDTRFQQTTWRSFQTPHKRKSTFHFHKAFYDASFAHPFQSLASYTSLVSNEISWEHLCLFKLLVDPLFIMRIPDEIGQASVWSCNSTPAAAR